MEDETDSDVIDILVAVAKLLQFLPQLKISMTRCSNAMLILSTQIAIKEKVEKEVFMKSVDEWWNIHVENNAKVEECP